MLPRKFIIRPGRNEVTFHVYDESSLLGRIVSVLALSQRHRPP